MYMETKDELIKKMQAEITTLKTKVEELMWYYNQYYSKNIGANPK
jgi:hypothetical protein